MCACYRVGHSYIIDGLVSTELQIPAYGLVQGTHSNMHLTSVSSGLKSAATAAAAVQRALIHSNTCFNYSIVDLSKDARLKSMQDVLITTTKMFIDTCVHMCVYI